MKATTVAYNHLDSVARIDEILAGADAVYEEVDSIPPRERLTFSNGFYVNCSALFVDLRGSSTLTEKYKRPTLAKIYRAYVSECVAIVNSNANCSEILIEGDAVAGVFDTTSKSAIDALFSTAAQVNSLIRTLNCRYAKYGIEPVAAGLGLSYGRALMIKAGHKGSAVNEVVWLGDVVNESATLCSYGSRTWNDRPIMVSRVFHGNLNEDNRSLLAWNSTRGCYHGNVVNTEMEEWHKKHCT